LVEKATAKRHQADALGKQLAAKLVAKGADRILAALDGHK